jgi:hypothetical protein
MGRPPLHPDQKRTEYIKARTTLNARKAFLAVCAEHGYTEAKAVREALSDWINKMRSKK